MEEGDNAKDFSLKNQNNKERNLNYYKNKKLILYFYPKDDTPGCTKEACSLRDGIKELEDNNYVVVGVSPDNAEKHTKFITKYNLPFELLVDENHELAEKYGVWVEKNMYGRKYMGIARTTFVIENEKIQKIYNKVNVGDHANQIIGDTNGN